MKKNIEKKKKKYINKFWKELKEKVLNVEIASWLERWLFL